MANYELITWDGTGERNQREDSNSLTLDLTGVQIGASNLLISEDSGNLDVNSVRIVNVNEPVDNYDAVNKEYIVSGQFFWDLINEIGSPATFGQIVYQTTATDFDLANATITNLDKHRLGVVGENIAIGASGRIYFRYGALVSGLSGLTTGATYYVGKTDGVMVTTLSGFTTGDYVYKIGQAISTTSLLFEPEFEFVY